MIGREILFFPEVDSTNTKAREHSLKGAGEGVVILAESQSKGKGRLGRQWQSPPGVNLYASIILRPSISPAVAQQITLLAGMAGANALARATGLDARIKWPNDIFVHGKKVAGILSEMEAEGLRTRFIVLGVGVNVNWEKEDVPPEIREIRHLAASGSGMRILPGQGGRGNLRRAGKGIRPLPGRGILVQAARGVEPAILGEPEMGHHHDDGEEI